YIESRHSACCPGKPSAAVRNSWIRAVSPEFDTDAAFDSFDSVLRSVLWILLPGGIRSGPSRGIEYDVQRWIQCGRRFRFPVRRAKTEAVYRGAIQPHVHYTRL